MARVSEGNRPSSPWTRRTYNFSRFLVAVVMPLLGCAPAFAQSPLDKLLDQRRVQGLITLGLQNIQRGKCGGEKFCSPATSEELKSPPISVDQAREAVKAGMNSAILQWCGLQWAQRSFSPFMYQNRHVAKLNQRQLALVAMLHGIQQGMLFDALKKDQGNCPDQMKRKFAARLPYRMPTQ